jgi:hypothetical protein
MPALRDREPPGGQVVLVVRPTTQRVFGPYGAVRSGLADAPIDLSAGAGPLDVLAVGTG